MGATTATKSTRVKNQPQRYGQMNCVIADVVLSTSYATNGDTLSPASIGFRAIYGMQVIGWANAASAQATSCTMVKPDLTSETAPLLVCFTGAGVQVSNATDLSAVTARLMIWGV